MDSSDHDWNLHWESPQCVHSYDPLYLANTHFGTLCDLTGTDFNLWDSRITGLQERPSEEHAGIQFPVTAIRTQVHYRNAHFRARGFWVGNAGVLSDRPEYVQHPAMPQRAQIYENRQSLQLAKGIAITEGTLFLGSYSSLQSGAYAERAIPFKSTVAFLKDAPVLGLAIEVAADTDIMFDPLPVLEDSYVVRNSGLSIYSLGNDLDEDVCVHQRMLGRDQSTAVIAYRLQPNGGEPYTVTFRAEGASLTEEKGRPGFEKRGSLFVTVTILRDSQTPLETDLPRTPEAFFAEQAKRWGAFWAKSDVTFPAHEREWQQRYRASLFYVAQSLNDAPSHPGGLSKPMIPYWYGSFHDTDTYFCRPLLEAGHGEQALRYLNYRHRTLSKAFSVAEKMGLPGAMYPWQTDPLGNGERRDTPINQAIVAVEAWHQFIHTGVEEALTQAHEIITGVFRNLLHNLDVGSEPLVLKDAYLNTFSETIRAKQPGEVVLALRCVAHRYLAACQLGGQSDRELQHWAERIVSELRLPVAPDGSYRIFGETDPEYMRCPSITLGSFPLHSLNADEALAKTYDKELASVFSIFSWMPHLFSIVASQLQRRAGMNNAWEVLNDSLAYDKTWFAVDEWENRRTVRPQIFVTAAGGHCSAIHAMMLAETRDGEWTVFAGCPLHWQEASFRDLHSRAGWRVSARMEEGRVVAVSCARQHRFALERFVLRVPHAHAAIAISGDAVLQEWQDETLVLSAKPEA